MTESLVCPTWRPTLQTMMTRGAALCRHALTIFLPLWVSDGMYHCVPLVAVDLSLIPNSYHFIKQWSRWILLERVEFLGMHSQSCSNHMLMCSRGTELMLSCCRSLAAGAGVCVCTHLLDHRAAEWSSQKWLRFHSGPVQTGVSAGVRDWWALPTTHFCFVFRAYAS